MFLVVTMFAAAALVWTVPLAPRVRLVPLACLILGVGTIFGPSFFAVDGPIQISADRLLFFAAFALAFVGFRCGATRLPSLHRIDWLIFAIVGWFGFCVFLGGTEQSVGTPPLARWLFYIAMPAGMYALARFVTIRTSDVSWVSIGFILLSCYLAITAILEIAGLHDLVFPRYIVDAERWEFFGRGRGPLMNPAGNGVVIAIGLVAAAVNFFQSGRQGRALYGAIAICLLAGTYATLTRSCWLGAIAGIGIVILMYSPRTLRLYGLVCALVLSGLAATGVKDQLMSIKRDKNLSAADAAKSVQLRPLLAIVAWEMFKDRPIAGHGYGLLSGVARALSRQSQLRHAAWRSEAVRSAQHFPFGLGGHRTRRFDTGDAVVRLDGRHRMEARTR